jgi:hypothetical protein
VSSGSALRQKMYAALSKWAHIGLSSQSASSRTSHITSRTDIVARPARCQCLMVHSQSCLPFSAPGIPEHHDLSSQRLEKPFSRLTKLWEARLGTLCISTPHVSHSRLRGDHSSPVYSRHAAEPHESPTPLLLWALLRAWLESMGDGQPCCLAKFRVMSEWQRKGLRCRFGSFHFGT